MSLSATQIQALVRDMDESLRRHKRIRESQPDVWEKKLQDENRTLYEHYPTIFKLHLQGKLDETFFYMLQLKRKIEKNEMTEDEASVLVGKKLFNRYVDPVIKKEPSPETISYEEYYNKTK